MIIVPEMNYLMELDPTHDSKYHWTHPIYNPNVPDDIDEWFNCGRYEEAKGG